MRIFIITLTFLTACATRSPIETKFYETDFKIGKVEVSIDKQAAGIDRSNIYDKLGGSMLIQAQTTQQLNKYQLLDESSDISMQLVVDYFRLRHGSTHLFFGIYSGRDQIAAKVKIFRNDKLIAQYDTDYGAFSRGFDISRDSRGNRLFLGIAEQAIGDLRRNLNKE